MHMGEPVCTYGVPLTERRQTNNGNWVCDHYRQIANI